MPNPNADAVLHPASEFDPNATVTDEDRQKYCRDVTEEVLCGKRAFLGVTGPVAIQIVGGTRPDHRVADLSRGQASALLNDGMDLSDAGRTEEALRYLERVVTAYTHWSNQGDESASLKLGIALFTIGRTLRGAGRFDEASAKFAEALTIYERLQAGALRAAALEETGWVLADQSWILRDCGQFEEALACARRAVETVDGIVEPTDETRLKIVLRWALRCEGKALDRLHRSAEASACYQRAAELRDKAKSTRSEHGGSPGTESLSEGPRSV